MQTRNRAVANLHNRESNQIISIKMSFQSDCPFSVATFFLFLFGLRSISHNNDIGIRFCLYFTTFNFE